MAALLLTNSGFLQRPIALQIILLPKSDLVSSGADCSKLTTSLVNISLKFQTLISQIRPHVFLKKM